MKTSSSIPLLKPLFGSGDESIPNKLLGKPFCNRYGLRARRVRKACAAVKEEVEALTQNVDILKNEARYTIPSFDRSQIEVGELLGSGSFSQVFAVSHIRCPTVEEQEENGTSTSEEKSSELMQDNNDNGADARSCSILNGCPDRSCGDGREGLVVKQLKKKLLRRPREFEKAAANLLVEANFLSMLDHPNILKLRGISKGGAASLSTGRYDSVFLLLDRLTCTLEHRINQWKAMKNAYGCCFPPASSLTQKSIFALQMAQALSYLHSRRVIFRDLKPANIGFTRDDTVQLFDFGLCRELPEQSRYDDPQQHFFRMTATGTRRYMAVEIFLSGRYNLKADVYSWAMTFYEMLTLTRPYEGMNFKEIVQFACRDAQRPDLSIIEGLPASLRKLMDQSWAQFVMDRVSMPFVCNALEEILERDLEDGPALKRAYDERSISSNTISSSDLSTAETWLSLREKI